MYVCNEWIKFFVVAFESNRFYKSEGEAISSFIQFIYFDSCD